MNALFSLNNNQPTNKSGINDFLKLYPGEKLDLVGLSYN